MGLFDMLKPPPNPSIGQVIEQMTPEERAAMLEQLQAGAQPNATPEPTQAQATTQATAEPVATEPVAAPNQEPASRASVAPVEQPTVVPGTAPAAGTGGTPVGIMDRLESGNMTPGEVSKALADGSLTAAWNDRYGQRT